MIYHLDRYALIGSYHPSQRNTQTGLLTPAMFDRIFRQAQRFIRREGDNLDIADVPSHSRLGKLNLPLLAKHAEVDFVLAVCPSRAANALETEVK